MSLFVDTSVWSLAFRRDVPAAAPEAERLREALTSGEPVFTTGLVLQELLQGFAGPKAQELIRKTFAPLPLVAPDRDDHVGAAALRNECRRHGLQLGTIDALLTRLCIRHGLTMLSTDQDFRHASGHVPLRLWSAEPGTLRPPP